jgi:hypothetical protein
MEDALLLIAAIAAFGLLSVVMPAMLEAYYRYKKNMVVTCPNAEKRAELTLDRGRAALGAAFGKPALRVATCSLWPLQQACHAECLRENSFAAS